MTSVGQLCSNFVGFKNVQNVDFARGWKKVFGQIVSDGPKGQLKQSKLQSVQKKGKYTLSCFSERALLG